MESETDNTGTTPELSDDQVHDQMMREAEAEDAGREVEPSQAEPSTQEAKPEGFKEEETGDRAPDAAKPTDKAPDSPEPSADKPRDESGKFIKKADSPEGEQQPESKYKKAKKDQERFERNWKKLEERQAQVRQRETELRQAAEQMQRAPRQPDLMQQPRFSSREYAAAADQMEAKAAKLIDEGDLEGAKSQIDLARQARGAAQQYWQVEQEQAMRQQAGQFAQTWQGTADALIQQTPSLADAESEDAQDMLDLLEREPILGYIPDGFKKGWELLQTQRLAAEASGLKEENKKLKEENERLNKLTSPQGEKTSTRRSVPTDFSKMSLEQQGEWLRRDAEAQDAA